MPLDLVGRLPSSEAFRNDFARAGLAQPIIAWDPKAADIHHPAVSGFAALCNRLRTEVGSVPIDSFMRADLSWMADHLAILRPLAGGTDFAYEWFGRDLAETRRGDLTGRTIDALDQPLRRLMQTLYVTSLRSRLPVQGIYEPAQHIFAESRIFYIQPLTDAAGSVCRLATFKIADSSLRPGLDALPDPAFVLRPNGEILFVNGAARLIFGACRLQDGPITLAAYCGLEIDLDAVAWSQHLTLRDRATATLCGKAVVHFRLSARKVLFRDKPHFVVLAHPD
jgi:hypothetical protein